MESRPDQKGVSYKSGGFFSMVSGIISVITSPTIMMLFIEENTLCIAMLFSLLFGIIALIFGFKSYKINNDKFGLSGIILSLVAFILFITPIVLIWYFPSF